MHRYLGFITLVALLFYTACFAPMDRVIHTPPEAYSAAPPEPLQYAASNYLRQLFADMLLIKTKVFIGGLDSHTTPMLYADALASDFITMAKLNPKLLDTYFIGESSLGWIGGYYVRQANIMLEIGIENRPDQWIFPFFTSFNYFFYLQDSRSAIDYMQLTYQRGGPAWVQHLSSLLAGQSGQLAIGLTWLKSMHHAENNPKQKKRYAKDIHDFEYAITIQQALTKYKLTFNAYPDSLSKLVPTFMPHIDTLGFYHEIHYRKPHIFLTRIQRKKK